MNFELPTASPFLPSWILNLNLISAFMWYISTMFVVSVILRIRFYRAIYLVTNFVSKSCPNVYRLVHAHWYGLLREGMIPLVSIYATILIAYLFMTRIACPSCSLTPASLASIHPGVFVLQMLLIGAMLAIDIFLLLQVTIINVEDVKSQLTFAEGWLGGRLNNALQYLGRWNPIKRFADVEASKTIRWFGTVVNGGLKVMIVELAVRLVVAAFLFTSYVMLTGSLPDVHVDLPSF